jgi:mediator of RNA polymerase II transcription subunit 10
MIPLQVLNYVDEGRNPDLFTQHQLEKTLADYQAVQKKAETYKV